MARSETVVDEAILRTVKKNWLKVAMVIARVIEELDLSMTDDSCELVARRIRALVDGGQLDSQGDIRLWRHSEVRLPATQ